eukprot:5833597-Pyramimonas_sp.AAC.1
MASGPLSPTLHQTNTSNSKLQKGAGEFPISHQFTIRHRPRVTTCPIRRLTSHRNPTESGQRGLQPLVVALRERERFQTT